MAHPSRLSDNQLPRSCPITELDKLAVWMEDWTAKRAPTHISQNHVVIGTLDDIAVLVRRRLEASIASHLPPGFTLVTYREWGEKRLTLDLGTTHTLIADDGKTYPIKGQDIRSDRLTSAVAEALLVTENEETANEETASNDPAGDDDNAEDTDEDE